MLIQLIIIQVATFIAIVLALRKLLYKETASEIRRLQKVKEEYVKSQLELEEKIRQTEAAYKEKVVRADTEARRIRSQAEEETAAFKKDAIAKAKEEAERITKAASGAREQIRDEISFETRRKAGEIALGMFKTILSPHVRVLIHKELLKDVAGHIKKIEKSRFKPGAKKAEIKTAYPLDKDQREELIAAVSERTDAKIPFDEKEDKNLTAGIVIELGNLVIDGSLENRLRQAAEE